MHSIYQFQQFPLNEQAQYVWDNGQFVESRTENDFSSNLYWMGNFYVEIVYNNSMNSIVEVVFKEAFHNN